jgi:hypothetical protein
VSSYRAGVNELGVKYIPSAIPTVPLNISRFSLPGNAAGSGPRINANPSGITS